MNNYFSHDSNARNSPELLKLRMKYGAEGYGIYFMILERLREEHNYMSIKDYNMLAFDFRVDASKVKSVIEDFGLFVFTDDGKYLYSEGFIKRMNLKDEKTRKLSEAGKKGCERRWNKTKQSPPDNHPIATLSPPDNNKRKEKESKEIPPIIPPSGGEGERLDHSTDCADHVGLSEAGAPDAVLDKQQSRFTPPTVEQVTDYCISRGNGISAAEFVDFYASKGWMVGRNKMKDWRAAVRTWENKRQQEHKTTTDLSIAL